MGWSGYHLSEYEFYHLENKIIEDDDADFIPYGEFDFFDLSNIFQKLEGISDEQPTENVIKLETTKYFETRLEKEGIIKRVAFDYALCGYNKDSLVTIYP